MNPLIRNRKFYWLATIITLLFLYVIFAFRIRSLISPDLHTLADIFFICMILFAIAGSRKFARDIIASRERRAFAVLFFVIFLFYALTKVSSFRRETAALNFLNRNEAELTMLMNENKADSLKPDQLTLERKGVLKFKQINGQYDFRLYRFMGYGYGLIYSDNTQLANPGNIGGSPIVNWFHLKEHWYYYSFLD